MQGLEGLEGKRTTTLYSNWFVEFLECIPQILDIEEISHNREPVIGQGFTSDNRISNIMGRMIIQQLYPIYIYLPLLGLLKKKNS